MEAHHESQSDVTGNYVPALRGASGHTQADVSDDDDDDDFAVEAAPLFRLNADANQQPSKLGRPRKYLQEFLLEHTRSASGATSSIDVVSVPAVPATRTSVQETCLDVLPPAPNYDDVVAVSGQNYLKANSFLEQWGQICQKSMMSGVTLDETVVEMAERFLDNERYHLVSGVVLQDMHGMHHSNLVPRLERMSASITLMNRYEKVSLESTLLSVCGKAGCILYLDAQSYDETPMMLAAKHAQYVSSELATQASISGEGPLAANQTLASPGVTLAKTKLLQIQNNSSLLVSIGATPCLFMAEVFNPLVAMTQCTAKNMLGELMQLDTVSKVSESFACKARLTCLDKAPANTLCERLIMGLRPSDWHELLVHCHCHLIHTAFKKTMQLVDNHVSSLIKLALSIREGAKMKLFRQALAKELHGRELIFVPPVAERAEKYKEHILQLVVKNDSQTLPRAALLLFALSGDWRNQKQLEFVVPPGTQPPSKSSIKDMMVRVLLLVMVSTQPPVFLRHRWNGSDQAIGYFILISAVHNLLLGTYQHFLALVGATKATPKPASNHVAAQAASQGVAGAYEQGGQDQLAVLEAAAQIPSVTEAPLGQDSGNMYAALNAQHRKDSHTYLLGDPLPHLLAMQIIVLPMSLLLAKQLQSGSFAFEKTERSRVAKDLLNGNSNPCRQFPLVLAACGVLEQECLKSLEGVMQADIWQIIPHEARTVGFRTLIHKLLARAGSAVYQLISIPHKLCPLSLFQVLEKQEVNDALLQLPICMKDSLTLQLERKYQSFLHPECLCILQSICHTLGTDISLIESRHSSIRRLLLSKSLQTHTYNLASASAEWIMQNCRKKAALWRPKQLRGKAQKLTPQNPQMQCFF
eukprot:6463501-Amphidinium_carterae.4